MQHIIVGVDGSDYGLIAAEYALEFAGATNDDIEAVGIIPAALFNALGKTPGELAYSQEILDGEHLAKRAVKDWFADAEGLCEAAGVCFGRSIDVGDPAHRLPLLATAAKLVVFGARGATGGPGIGRVAAAMYDRAVKPMMVTKTQYRPIKRVIIGWDGGPEAAHAAGMVYGPAKAKGWDVTIVVGAPQTSPEAESASFVAREMTAGGCNTTLHVRNAEARTLVLDAVREFDADLIAIGARKPGAAEALIFGSAWREIVENVEIPVLLYR